MPKEQKRDKSIPEEQKKDRIKEIMGQIEHGIQDVFQSGRLDEYLRIMGKFRRYSLNNTMLIFLQRPNATYCAGYRMWQDEFGRYVKKGEKGIKILAPYTSKRTVKVKKLDPITQTPMRDASGNAVMEEHTVQTQRYRTVTIFDVTQTDGPPMPQLTAELTDDVQQYEIFMEALRRTSPVPIEFKPLPDDVDGLFSRETQSIVLRVGMGQLQTVCAALHEISHSRVHGGEETEVQSKAEKEITAEGTAMAVCGFYGLDTSANSIPYLSTWSSGKDVPELKACLNTIMEATDALITDIDRNLAQICQERGIPVPKRLTTTKEEQLTDTDRITFLMPDPDVPEDALSAVGYWENDLLPLSRDKACAMMERDMTVYVVQSGENPFMAFDREDIQTQPEGTVFAVPREEWEASAEYQQAVQAQQSSGEVATAESMETLETPDQPDATHPQSAKRTGKGSTTQRKRTRRER